MRSFIGKGLIFVIFIALILIGCEGLTGPGRIDPIFGGPGAGESLKAVPSETGNLRVLITDAPFPIDLIESAFISVVRVDFVTASEGIVVVYDDEPFEVDLVRLRDGVTTELTRVDMPAGEYKQIRVVVGEGAQVVLKDGRTFDLKIPSGTASGIKIKADFAITDEVDLEDVILDFPIEKNFKVQGNPNTPAGIKGFMFKPVIHLKNGNGPGEDDIEVEGTIEAIGNNQITVGGIVINVDTNTRFSGFTDLADLEVGDRVEVEYIVLEDGTNLAWKIKMKAEEGEDDD